MSIEPLDRLELYFFRISSSDDVDGAASRVIEVIDHADKGWVDPGDIEVRHPEPTAPHVDAAGWATGLKYLKRLYGGSRVAAWAPDRFKQISEKPFFLS